ncbi:hypothetical protein RM423_18365 [Jatrophihabitans sp. DSM 44399]|uniref:Uncharacterized protein n=1 Tax=Jatrophihabitans lederbergiae TaxID=3075547 RepID=A0ABU2JEE4_9ACTN|nr:hypothetical protein [Jatrophihabitans sp. DSM 44399]
MLPGVSPADGALASAQQRRVVVYLVVRLALLIGLRALWDGAHTVTGRRGA